MSSLLELFKERISRNGGFYSFHPFFFLTLIGRLDPVVEVVPYDHFAICIGLTGFDHRTSLDLLIQTDLKTVLQ